MAGDLLPGRTLGGHDQGEPIGDRQRRKRGSKLAMLLVAQDDRFGSAWQVALHEPRSEASGNGRAARSANDQIRARPVQPAADVVRIAPALALCQKPEEGLL